MSRSSTQPPRASGLKLPVLILAGLMLLAGTASTAAQEASSPPSSGSPDASVMFEGQDDQPFAGAATPAEPDGSIVDPVERGWDHIVVAPDGRTLTVYYWDGVEACYGLARVDVTQAEGVVDIQLWTGTRPEAVGQMCIEMAQLYKTTVVLDEPVILGGVE